MEKRGTILTRTSELHELVFHSSNTLHQACSVLGGARSRRQATVITHCLHKFNEDQYETFAK